MTDIQKKALADYIQQKINEEGLPIQDLVYRLHQSLFYYLDHQNELDIVVIVKSQNDAKKIILEKQAADIASQIQALG